MFWLNSLDVPMYFTARQLTITRLGSNELFSVFLEFLDIEFSVLCTTPDTSFIFSVPCLYAFLYVCVCVTYNTPFFIWGIVLLCVCVWGGGAAMCVCVCLLVQPLFIAAMNPCVRVCLCVCFVCVCVCVSTLTCDCLRLRLFVLD